MQHMQDFPSSHWENNDKDIIKGGIFSPKSSKCFCIVFKIGFIIIPTLSMSLLCQSVILPLIIAGLHRFYCSRYLLTLFLMTTLCLLTLGGWLPSVPTPSELHRNLHFIFCDASVLRGKKNKNKADNHEKQWEGKKKFLLNDEYRLEGTFSLSYWSPLGANLFWVVTKQYTNPTYTEYDYLLVTERDKAQVVNTWSSRWRVFGCSLFFQFFYGFEIFWNKK